MVTLSDTGDLQVVCLGTEAPTQQVSLDPGTAKQNYEEMSIEHQRLLARIRSHEDDKQTEPSSHMIISPHLSSVIEASTEYIEDPTRMIARNDQGKVIRMKMKVSLSFRAAGDDSSILKNIQLQICLPPNVFAEQTTFKFAELNFGRSLTPPVIQFYLYPMRTSSPISSDISLTATYFQQGSQNGGLQRTAVASIKLPLAFFLQILPAHQASGQPPENASKINLILNKSAPSVLSLFEDVVESLGAREICQNRKQITFTYHTGAPITLIVSKDDMKVRVQGYTADFSTVWFIYDALTKRLFDLYSGSNIIHFHCDRQRLSI